MGRVEDLDGGGSYEIESASTRFRCEDCGYKWQVRGYNEETDEADGTVYYDANSDLEPSSCPLCGCGDILTL